MTDSMDHCDGKRQWNLQKGQQLHKISVFVEREAVYVDLETLFMYVSARLDKSGRWVTNAH